MKISSKITDSLGKLIAGDIGPAPYLTGPQLVNFFNDCGYNQRYGEGFPTRWRYAAERIGECNGTERLRIILEEFVDYRRYVDERDGIVGEIVSSVNRLINYDGYTLMKKGRVYKVYELDEYIVEPDTLTAINHDFVSEQIGKCKTKITEGDYSGAITNARTLIEAVCVFIIQDIENETIKNDGNVISLWGRTKKALKIRINKEDFPDYVFQILSGLDTLVNGLAALSNNAGDRHANVFKTKKHHAKLAVNSAMTLCDFLLDVLHEKN